MFVVISGVANPRALPFLVPASLVLVGLLFWLLRQPKSERGRLKLSAKVALPLVTLFIAGIVAEAVLQLCAFNSFRPLSPGFGYRHDPLLGWFPVPNDRRGGGVTITNNSVGFRGPEFPVDGKPSLLFLGDSMVWGYDIQAADRFTEKLQAAHPEWNIYNLGVVGYGTDQELLMLKRFVDVLKPSLVFLVFCAQNDHEDNSASARYGWYKPYFTTNGFGVQLGGTPVPCSEAVFWSAHHVLAHSSLLRLAVRAWKNSTMPPISVHDDPSPALLLEMQSYVRSKGAGLVVCLTADDPPISRLLEDSRISYVCLTNIATLPGDYHWSTNGNSVVAERLNAFITSNQVLSARLRVRGLR